MRRLVAAAAATAALLLPLPNCAAASSSRGPPSRQELQEKSMKELKAILKKKGVKCKKCLEKDDVVDRVLETWDVPPTEASSPDGSMRMTKEVFIKNLKDSYVRHLKSEKKGPQADGHQLDADGDDESVEVPEGMVPSDEQLEQVWREFSEKLSLGEVTKGEDGQLVYEVPSLGGGPSWWERWRIHIMMMANVALLWCIQRSRRRQKREAEVEKTEMEKTEPGETTSEEVEKKDK
mmetsp:Transcript_2710/g.5400  ORF Transcript_2710/g.5400 Transcript_2710/m.5400 type:complete len:235 (-) Transcript_2710:79-783(-)